MRDPDDDLGRPIIEETDEPGPEMRPDEMEGTRLLVNEAWEELRDEGWERDHIVALAERYNALGLPQAHEPFVAWLREHR